MECDVKTCSETKSSHEGQRTATDKRAGVQTTNRNKLQYPAHQQHTAHLPDTSKQQQRGAQVLKHL